MCALREFLLGLVSGFFYSGREGEGIKFDIELWVNIIAVTLL